MFTGLVEDLGTIKAAVASPAGRTLTVSTSWPIEELELGESIAVDGACLTVTSLSGDAFTVDASEETLEKTTLGRMRTGARVHLERALRLSDRLGGHLVLGHVDGVGKVVARQPVGDAMRIEFEAPEAVTKFLIDKGSVTVDGVSLTVNGEQGNRFWVVIIPHTSEVTKLAQYKVGTPVNLEADVIGKYVRKFVAGGDSSITAEFLERFGFEVSRRSSK